MKKQKMYNSHTDSILMQVTIIGLLTVTAWLAVAMLVNVKF